MLILSGTVTMLQDCKNVFITAMIFTYRQEICLLCTPGPRGGSTGSLGSQSRITCPFTCIPIHIPQQYNEANLYALYDKKLRLVSPIEMYRHMTDPNDPVEPPLTWTH